jgi:hypothetical protein
LAHLTNISCRLGVALQWDDKTGAFLGNPKANALVKAKYHAPWKLPII